MSTDDWSPADNPYSIAASEAWTWFRCILLICERVHAGDDQRPSGLDSRQLDARQLVVVLWQLLIAHELQRVAVRDLDMDKAVVVELNRARTRYEEALPGIRHMRDAILHFDEWARGHGRGPQQKAVRAGSELRDVASMYWNFGYDPALDTVTVGPYVIQLDTAIDAARALVHGIYQAAQAVDQRTAARLRARTVQALTTADSTLGAAGDLAIVSPGRDTKIWVSLRAAQGVDGRKHAADTIVAALRAVGLQLRSSLEPQSENPVERMSVGEALYVTEVDSPD
jgi:hypothetical protein